MRRVALCLCLCLSPAACTLPRVVATLDEDSPSPDLGRPGWVREPATFGAWVGGIAGSVASIITLPITWPISQLADEPLGWGREEFLWAPVSLGASAGHYLVGAPLDSLDFVLRRAWVPAPQDGELTLQPPPVGPPEPPPAAADDDR